jgi:hypothetical protein
MNLINWHWLEDLLVRACELEIRTFGLNHPEEPVFAFCLEYEGLDASLNFSYGTREAVETAVSSLRAEDEGEGVCYRAVELRPEHWRFRRQPRQDPEGVWSDAEPILERYRENMQEDAQPEVTEFLWLRFEYVAECVAQRLLERGTFRYLNRELEFLAYAANEHESLEELEDRLSKLFPDYRRATVEYVTRPRLGQLSSRNCRGSRCRRRPRPALLTRCTYCQGWFCDRCLEEHSHPELFSRRPFFASSSSLGEHL